MNTQIKPMPLWVSAVMFGVPTVVFYIATGLLIPLLGSHTAVHPALLWFAVGGVVVVLLPILFVLPFVVQKRGNTWVGVVIHALVNGPAFVMVSLGLVG